MKNICSYSGIEFTGECPIKECPAFFDSAKANCAFIEMGASKAKLTQFDIAQLSGISLRTAESRSKKAKQEIGDAMKIIVMLLKIEPKGKKLEVSGEFFDKIGIPIHQNQLNIMVKQKPIKAALRRRMAPGQFSKYIKQKGNENGKPTETHPERLSTNVKRTRRGHRVRRTMGN